MIGSILGAGTKILGSVVGGIAGARAHKKQAEELAKKEAANSAWYNQEISKDYTQRAEAQNSINKMRDVFLERQRNAAATSAVAGGTSEGEALLKEQSADAMADTIGNLAVASEAQKDAAGVEYRNRANEIMDAKIQNEQDRKDNIAKAVSGVLDAGTGIASGLTDLGGSGVKVGQTSKAINAVTKTPNMLNVEEKLPTQVTTSHQPQGIDIFGLRKSINNKR